ncbi:MAG TPA: DUF3108 domain-containing protein [Pyrinomonadaceae bacterium]|nr:DUF3108 domain-containing protein [Pyrinomonadaceae bacterium]
MILRLRKTVLISFCVLALAWTSPAILAQSSTTTDRPFEPAEELIYKAEFSRSLLRKLDVANFKLTVNRVAIANAKSAANESQAYTLKLTGDAVSQGFFAKLFGLNFHQRVESTVEPESFAVQKTSRLDEQGKRVRASEAVFDHDRRQVTWVERDPGDPARAVRRATAKFEEPIQDILSAIYFLRLRNLEPGKKFQVPISDSGRVYQISISVVERKRMKTQLGRVSVVRIDPELFGPGGMIAEDGKFSIWLTDDERRIPVSARIKTEYGTFDITLKKASRQPGARAIAADHN